MEQIFMWSSIRKRRNERVDHVLRYGGLLGLIIEGRIEEKTVEVNRA